MSNNQKCNWGVFFNPNFITKKSSIHLKVFDNQFMVHQRVSTSNRLNFSTYLELLSWNPNPNEQLHPEETCRQLPLKPTIKLGITIWYNDSSYPIKTSLHAVGTILATCLADVMIGLLAKIHIYYLKLVFSILRLLFSTLKGNILVSWIGEELCNLELGNQILSNYCVG